MTVSNPSVAEFRGRTASEVNRVQVMGLVKTGRMTMDQAVATNMRAPSAIVQLALLPSSPDLVKVETRSGVMLVLISCWRWGKGRVVVGEGMGKAASLSDFLVLLIPLYFLFLRQHVGGGV